MTHSSKPTHSWKIFFQRKSQKPKLCLKFFCFFLYLRIYLTTKLARPHYPAEITAKVAILDFRVTFAGMETYLLGVIVSRDRPDVEAEKNQIVTMKVDTYRYERVLKIHKFLFSSQENFTRYI